MAYVDQAIDERVRKTALSFALIWLFVVAIYARPEDVFPSLVKFHLPLVIGACATATLVWAIFIEGVPLRWPSELVLMFLLTAWFAAGVPFAYWRSGSFDVLTQVWLKTLLLFFLVTQTLVTIKRIRAVLWAIILSELAVAAYSIFASSGVKWLGGRMFGVNLGILGWNFLGIAAATTIPYIAALFIAHSSFMKSSLLAAATAAMLWMLVLTASRSGMMDVAVSVGLTSFLVLRGSSRGKAIGLGIIFALLITVSLAPKIFWERMATISSDDSAVPADRVQVAAVGSTDDRMAVLVRSIDYTISHPLFGLGLGNLGVASGNELLQPGSWVGSHNTFTEISSEAGIPALLLFLALIATAFRSMRRISRTAFDAAEGAELRLMSRASLASLFSFIFAAFFAHIGYEYFFYTCPIAIAVGLHHVASVIHRPAPVNQGLRKQPQSNPVWAQ